MRYCSPEIKRKILLLCKGKGIPVKDFEKAVGVSHGYFNKGGISLEVLMRCCEALDMTMKEVVQ